MTTLLPSWTLEEVETTLLRLVRGSDRVMVHHLVEGFRETLPAMDRSEALLELLALMAVTLQGATQAKPPGLDGTEAPMA